MSDIRDEVFASFTEVFGRSPSGVWSAPGRVNLIGEHTDYNEGFVLPFAIGRRTYAALALRDDRMLRVASTFADELAELHLDDITESAASGWSAYPLGVVWALKQIGADLSRVRGANILIDSDVPVGAGLSSSAALECAVALALNEVWDLGLEISVLARAGQLAENGAVGAPTGIMDQVASLFGRNGSAVLIDCRSLQSQPVTLDLAGSGLTILAIDTGTPHDLATNGYASRRSSCERAALELGVRALRDVTVDDMPRAKKVLDASTFRLVRHVVTENERVLDTVRVLEDVGPVGIGDLLTESHWSLRDDFEVSTPELDLAVETALAHGALGARMTGAGFGGTAIALIPLENESLLRVAIDGAFAEHGFSQPDTFTVSASVGAQRDV